MRKVWCTNRTCPMEDCLRRFENSPFGVYILTERYEPGKKFCEAYLTDWEEDKHGVPEAGDKVSEAEEKPKKVKSEKEKQFHGDGSFTADENGQLSFFS